MKFLMTLTDNFEFVHTFNLYRTPLLVSEIMFVEHLSKKTCLATFKARQPRMPTNFVLATFALSQTMFL